MTVHDLTTQKYKGAPAKKNKEGVQFVGKRIIGTMLTGNIDGATPADGDTFKIAKISKHQMVPRVFTIVTDADDTSDLLDVGYTDGTNASTTAFDTDVNLNATGVTESSDDKVFFDDDGYYLTITVADISNLDDATEFTVLAEIVDCIGLGITTALTAPV